MKFNGFNPQQLVNRGMCESVEELDRVMLELDEARKSPVVIAVSWQQGFRFQVGISGARMRTGAGGAATSPFGNGYAVPVAAGAGVETMSQRSPELVSASAAVLCPWCAIERAMSGQGAAPRTGFVPVARCARHVNESPTPTVAASYPHNRSAA